MSNSASATARLGPDRPFPGLRAYGLADHHYFFGREDQVFALYRLLDRSRFAAVVGASGSGKSSLVRAGLLPLLQEETDEGRARRWVWFELRPGNTPLARLADGLTGTQVEASDERDLAIHGIRRETVEVLLRRSSFGLREALREIDKVERCSILIVVDQFEEIFRYADLAEGENDDPLLRESRLSQAAAFVQLLLEASRDPSRPVHVMLTMRSDYLGDCALFHDLPEAVAASQFLVPSLTRDQREQAIRGPIEQAGATIEAELVQRLLNDSGAGNDQLPVLQHALIRTWDAAGRQNRVSSDAAVAPRTPPHGCVGWRHLMSGHYEAIGTLSNALSQHAEEIMSELGGLEQAVEQTFRALAELDRDSRAIRRPRSFDRLLAETGVPDAELRRVLDRFRREDCSFLVPAYPQPVTGDTIVDIGHEALIRRWDRMGANLATGSGGKGWLWTEADDANVYRGLLTLAGDSASATLPLDQVESRWRWWTSRPRTEAWAERYGGHLDSVERLFKNSLAALDNERERRRAEEQLREDLARKEQERQRLFNDTLRLEERQARLLAEKSQLEQQALSAQLAEQTKLAQEHRRFTQLAAAAAVVLGILALLATGGFLYAFGQKVRADAAAEQALAEAERADQALTDTKASSLWSRLQLWRDPLPPEDVTALWDLAREDEKVRVQFVRQLAKDRVLLGRFGRNPMPLARAVGLKWPDEAGRAAQQGVEYVATESFNFESIDPFELTAYVRAVLALARRDRPVADETKKIIDTAIKHLSGQVPDAKIVSALAQIADAVGEPVTPEMIIEPETIKAARKSLRDAIASAKPNEDRFMAVSRAIEIMAPSLSPSERGAALDYQLALLGKQVDTPWAPIAPRAVLALLPTLKPGEAPDMPKTVLHAVVASAASKSDSSYLLALMQVVEMFGVIPDKAAGATFGQALVEEFAKGDAVPRGALARAAIPLLERRVEGTSRLVAPVAQAIFGGAVSSDIEDQIRQALFSRDPDRKRAASEAVLPALLDEWTTKWPAITAPQKSSELYRRAAQARLIAALAQLLTSASATDAMNAVLLILKQPDIPDYFAGEAMARALEALAPQLPQSVRDGALSPAKSALAGTGSREEAIAWTRAITALLPADRDAFTHGVIEVLKYPTAAGAPTDMLLAELASRWPDEDALKGKPLPDKALLDWLEAHLPDGHSLADPPTPPPSTPSEDAGPMPG